MVIEPDLERAVVTITNVDRTSNGVGSLLPDARLGDLARERSQDMRDRGYLCHAIPPDGKRIGALMSERGFSYDAAGENIGFNSERRDATVQYSREQWLASETHRPNVLFPGFRTIGVGSISGPSLPIRPCTLTQDYAVQFIHTVLFLQAREGVATAPAVSVPTPPAGVADVDAEGEAPAE